MIAPLATLAFLAALWLIAKTVFDALAEDGGKIMLALRGRSALAYPVQTVRPVTVRYQPRAGSVRRPVRLQPQPMRAAA